MNFLKKQIYELILGATALVIFTLLIIYLVLAMISITSGVSQAIGVASGNNKTVSFDLNAAALLKLD